MPTIIKVVTDPSTGKKYWASPGTNVGDDTKVKKFERHHRVNADDVEYIGDYASEKTKP